MTIKTLEVEKVNEVNALTDRVKRRKEELIAAEQRISAARSHLATESWRETEGQPVVLRRAELFKKVMEGIPIHIEDGELIVGYQSEYIRGASPHNDWDPYVTFQNVQMQEVVTTRGEILPAGLTEEEKRSLLEDAKYWLGKNQRDACQQARERDSGDLTSDIYEARVIQAHPYFGNPVRTVPWGVINMGLNAVIAQAREEIQKLDLPILSSDYDKLCFLQAAIISCGAVIKWANRYGELAKELAGRESNVVRKRELEKIAQHCEWVPANPPRTFHEALQSFWFIHLAMNLESCYVGETPGRMDYYLYPYYERDIKEGRITRQEAAELLGLLWVKHNEWEKIAAWQSKAVAPGNTMQLYTICGLDRDGKDVGNELTLLILEVARQMKMPQPPIYLRYHDGVSDEILVKAAECNRDIGAGIPCFVGEHKTLFNLVKRGIPLDDARDWVLQACLAAVVGGIDFKDGMGILNVPKVLELALNNGVDPRTGKQLGLATGDAREFVSYEELYEAFKKQIDYFVKVGTRAGQIVWHTRNQVYELPFASAIIDDCICITKGKGIFQSGFRYPQFAELPGDRGCVDTADALAAIKKLVFDEKKVNMAELLDALSVNWKGKEDLYEMCLAAPKYGNDDDYVDDIFNEVSLMVQRRITGEKNALGVKTSTHRPALAGHYYMGQTVGALPNPRKKWEPLYDAALSPGPGRDVNGPTAMLNSATKADHTEENMGVVLNMKFTPAALQDEKGLRKLLALIKTFFDRGGWQIQFNVLSRETLLEAQKHPEENRNLIVRVAGYSAYFVELSPAIQNEIIARTENVFA